MHNQCGTIECDRCKTVIAFACNGRGDSAFETRQLMWWFKTHLTNLHNFKIRGLVILCFHCEQAIGQIYRRNMNFGLLHRIIINNGVDKPTVSLREAFGHNLTVNPINGVVTLMDHQDYVVVTSDN